MEEKKWQEEVSTDLIRCKQALKKDAFDVEKMESLFSEMLQRYGEEIEGFDEGMEVITTYENQAATAFALGKNMTLIVERLSIIRKEGYRTDGLVRHALKDGVEGASYQYTFPEVRKIISEDETRSVFERNDLMDRIDQIETICRSLESKKHKWDQLRPYVVWLEGKDVKTAMLLLPLLQSIN